MACSNIIYRIWSAIDDNGICYHVFPIYQSDRLVTLDKEKNALLVSREKVLIGDLFTYYDLYDIEGNLIHIHNGED